MTAIVRDAAEELAANVEHADRADRRLEELASLARAMADNLASFNERAHGQSQFMVKTMQNSGVRMKTRVQVSTAIIARLCELLGVQDFSLVAVQATVIKAGQTLGDVARNDQRWTKEAIDVAVARFESPPREEASLRIASRV